jgi:hypothetical protein
MWRENASAATEQSRLQPIFQALAGIGVEPVPLLFSEELTESAREELLGLDGVLVWVDPLAYGRDRSRLDRLLRETADHGVWVSAHPDVILGMGTKEVLFTTRHLGWGTDTVEYRTSQEFRDRFPVRLREYGTRVVKQYRGNGGQGVWKVEFLGAAPDQDGGLQALQVRVLEARRNSLEEDMSLGDFMHRCEEHLAGAGRLIEQPFQERLPEGMIRCYLCQDSVIGFAHQLIRGLLPAPAGSDPDTLPQPGPRIMQPANAPGFERLRRHMESDWLPAMCRALDMETASLPVLWDADFLLGPKTGSGDDTYVLCEINVSCITPYPEFAAGQIAEAALAHSIAARQSRSPTA